MQAKDVVVPHPEAAEQQRFLTLLNSSEIEADDLVAYIIDDRNRVDRRLRVLQRLDQILGIEKEHRYDVDDLRDFMKDPVNPRATHLSLVEVDVPTGNYAICETCSGIGTCNECEYGLIDLDTQGK